MSIAHGKNLHAQKEVAGARAELGTSEPILQDRIAGCLLGGAIGDALGAPVEFVDIIAIRDQFGPQGIRDFSPAYGKRGSITDDTQMTLFTAEGLIRAFVRQQERGICSIPSVVHHAYLRWLLTQGERPQRFEIGTDGWLYGVSDLHHRRAPGNTCLGALRAASGIGEPEVAYNQSKGCGGIMRVAPVGLFQPVIGSDSEVFELAKEIAALTHGHPSGMLAAGHFALPIAALSRGETLRSAVEIASAELRNHPGHDEVTASVDSALRLVDLRLQPSPEVIALLGEGWTAEEALAIAIYCSVTADTFAEGVLLAVNHSGDSDSTGSITGNLLGARLGSRAIPVDWLTQLEMRGEVERISMDLGRIASSAEVPDDVRSYPGW